MTELPCLIVEVSEAHQWTTTPWCPAKVIPTNRRPTMLQPNRETAEREALRLAGEHPGSTFAVFVPAIAALTTKVPTHVTMGGKVFAERSVPALVGIGVEPEDDGLPF